MSRKYIEKVLPVFLFLLIVPALASADGINIVEEEGTTVGVLDFNVSASASTRYSLQYVDTGGTLTVLRNGTSDSDGLLFLNDVTFNSSDAETFGDHGAYNLTLINRDSGTTEQTRFFQYGSYARYFDDFRDASNLNDKHIVNTGTNTFTCNSGGVTSVTETTGTLFSGKGVLLADATSSNDRCFYFNSTLTDSNGNLIVEKVMFDLAFDTDGGDEFEIWARERTGTDETLIYQRLAEPDFAHRFEIVINDNENVYEVYVNGTLDSTTAIGSESEDVVISISGDGSGTVDIEIDEVAVVPSASNWDFQETATGDFIIIYEGASSNIRQDWTTAESQTDGTGTEALLWTPGDFNLGNGDTDVWEDLTDSQFVIPRIQLSPSGSSDTQLNFFKGEYEGATGGSAFFDIDFPIDDDFFTAETPFNQTWKVSPGSGTFPNGELTLHQRKSASDLELFDFNLIAGTESVTLSNLGRGTDAVWDGEYTYYWSFEFQNGTTVFSELVDFAVDQNTVDVSTQFPGNVTLIDNDPVFSILFDSSLDTSTDYFLDGSSVLTVPYGAVRDESTLDEDGEVLLQVDLGTIADGTHTWSLNVDAIRLSLDTPFQGGELNPPDNIDESVFNFSTSEVTFTVLSDETNREANISLDNPFLSQIISTSEITFNYTVETNTTGQISLVLDDVNVLTRNKGSTGQESFNDTVTVAQGTHEWFVTFTSDDTGRVYAPASISFSNTPTASINLIRPADEALLADDTQIFIAELTRAEGMEGSLSLEVDGQTREIIVLQESLEDNEAENFTFTVANLTDGKHTWRTRYDNTELSVATVSETREFTIQGGAAVEEDDVQVGSGGGDVVEVETDSVFGTVLSPLALFFGFSVASAQILIAMIFSIMFGVFVVEKTGSGQFGVIGIGAMLVVMSFIGWMPLFVGVITILLGLMLIGRDMPLGK